MNSAQHLRLIRGGQKARSCGSRRALQREVLEAVATLYAVTRGRGRAWRAIVSCVSAVQPRVRLVGRA
jgi:hypothetical protein